MPRSWFNSKGKQGMTKCEPQMQRTSLQINGNVNTILKHDPLEIALVFIAFKG